MTGLSLLVKEFDCETLLIIHGKRRAVGGCLVAALVCRVSGVTCPACQGGTDGFGPLWCQVCVLLPFSRPCSETPLAQCSGLLLTRETTHHNLCQVGVLIYIYLTIWKKIFFSPTRYNLLLWTSDLELVIFLKSSEKWERRGWRGDAFLVKYPCLDYLEFPEIFIYSAFKSHSSSFVHYWMCL